MIYVLEDDESIRELIIYTLNGQSMEARGFAAPSEFWAAMSEKTPSLVLLDIMLPEEDGFSILQKLRAAPATKRLPIIMLTAKGSEYDIVRGLDIGADDYIPKTVPDDGAAFPHPCFAAPQRGRQREDGGVPGRKSLCQPN